MFGSEAYSQLIFWVFAAIAVVPGLGILLAKDIVRQAFWLLLSLVGFAGLYLHLGADFLGFTQVIVYIGGILVLFLFGVMLTQRADVPLKAIKGWGLIVPGVIAGVATAALLLHLVFNTPDWHEGRTAGEVSTRSVAEIGREVMSNYILPFEVISLVLLVALVGATFVARRPPEEEGGEK